LDNEDAPHTLPVGATWVNDAVISMYHNYPIEERRFYTNTGCRQDGSDFWRMGNVFDDVEKAVHAARSAKFGSV
jgi:hypothetical protein